VTATPRDGIVVDASVAIDWLLGAGPPSAPQQVLHAPALIDYEVASVLRRLTLAGALPANRGRDALELWCQLDITRHPADLLLPRMWQLRNNLSAYDAAYVALAEALGLPLATADRRLAVAAAAHCDIAGSVVGWPTSP